MAVRLGTQDWINPGPFQAAAEMVVDAGRATGAGIAALGAGIGQGLQNRQARQERAQNRQDALDQRGIDNARADRAEARVVAEGKLDFLQKNVAASQIEFEMMRTRYEMDGSSESEAAMNQSAQKVKTAIDLYKMGLGTHGGVVQPHGPPTTDYVGVGNGVAVNGKPTSQMTDAELDDLMGKSERGEVDYTYRGGATGDMGQGVGGATVRPRAAPPEVGSFTFPAEVDTADEYAQVASQLLAEAALVESSAGHLKPSSRAASAAKGRAAVLRQRAAFANFRAGTLADEAKATREQAEKVAEEQRKAAEDERQAARLTADARNRGYKGEPFQSKDAALKWLEENKQINVMDARNAFTALRDEKKAAILSAYREKTFGLKREALDLAKAKFELEKAGDASAASKADARLSKTWNDVADYAEQVLREYQFVTGAENLQEVKEARSLQAEAGRELIKLARDSMKPKTAAPAPAAASDAPPSFVPPDMVEDWKKMTPAQKDKVKQAFGGG